MAKEIPGVKLPPLDRAASLAAWDNRILPKHKIVPRKYIQSDAPTKPKTPTVVKVVVKKKIRRK